MGEEIHTWLNSALGELPTADEIRALAQSPKAAPGATAPAVAAAPALGPEFTTLLREILREEVGRLAGQKAEAIAWEVIPPMAETVIKQQLANRA